jgi:hypothetical protein
MRHARYILLATLLALGACFAGLRRDTGLGASPEPASTQIDLSIESHNWADCVIFVEHDGQRNRVGLAKAAAVTAMRIPPGWVGSAQTLHLVAHRVGSRTEHRSEAFVVLSDQKVTWTLETDLQGSSLTVR